MHTPRWGRSVFHIRNSYLSHQPIARTSSISSSSKRMKCLSLVRKDDQEEGMLKSGVLERYGKIGRLGDLGRGQRERKPSDQLRDFTGRRLRSGFARYTLMLQPSNPLPPTLQAEHRAAVCASVVVVESSGVVSARESVS